MTLKEMAKALTVQGKAVTAVGRQLRAIDALGKAMPSDARDSALDKLVGDLRVVRHEVSQLADRLGLEVLPPVADESETAN